MNCSLKLFPNGAVEQSRNEAFRQEGIIQTIQTNEQTIHWINHSKAAEYFLHFFSCPFLNIHSFSPRIHKVYLSYTLFTENVSDRKNLSEMLTTHFSNVLIQEATRKSVRNFTNKLIEEWSQQSPKELNLKEELGLLFNRWTLNGLLGIHHNLEALAQSAHFLFNVPTFSNAFKQGLNPKELIQTYHLIKLKGLLSKSIKRLQEIQDPLVCELIKNDFDLEKIKGNFQAILCILNQSGMLLTQYLIWNISKDKDLKDLFQSHAINAEKIFAESNNWEDYIEALQPFKNLVKNWIQIFPPKKWESLLPHDACLEGNDQIYSLKKGEKVIWHASNIEEIVDAEFENTFLIENASHQCQLDKNFNLIICIILSMLMSKIEFLPQQSDAEFEMHVYPTPINPLMFFLNLK